MGNSFPFKGLPHFVLGPKVYTRSDEIQDQLRNLANHIEQVVQKYLGSDFSSLEEFNQAKPFAAEAFHYLFISDFPTGFNNRAFEDLIAILENGHRASISVVLHVSQDAEWPRNINRGKIEQYCTVLTPTNKVIGKRPSFSYSIARDTVLEVSLDQAPDKEIINAVIKKLGDEFRSVKVETVPFNELYPEPFRAWTYDSRHEIRAPIGIMGAMDSLDFWLGTNQDDIVISQALLAGKPGAGKSYTLHAIINSLALRYSPLELELYLLDFKEGVEFQVYIDPTRSQTTNFNTELNDSQALPHAKVISIESDREFGLSILQHVQRKIEQRGQLFKKVGVAKLSEYREQTNQYMPRILVVIDEFQYMFQENDSITKELNLIIEDIARRGRAFGVHMLLASQSPRVTNISSSIYSFIELRMAQQMDQRTAGAILDENNVDAVELLDRPGRIIYNRDFGRKAYNELGQVADASEAARRAALIRIQEIAKGREYLRPAPLVVFNGSRPTKLSQNHQLVALTRQNRWLCAKDLNKHLLKLEDWDVEDVPGVAWLGEAMRIGNHTQAIFRRRPRSNMLLVGRSEETIYGILGGILISLVHSYQPQKARFCIIDLSQNDDEKPWTYFSLYFRKAFGQYFPTFIAKRQANRTQQIVQAETLLQTIWKEFERRKTIRDADPDAYKFGPSLFVIYAIGSLNRASNLRPLMGKRNEEMSEDAQALLQLVTEGPELGIHTTLWFDELKSITSLTTDKPKSLLAQFDMRTILSMSGEDSKSLIGESYAQKLPPIRAYFKDYSTVDAPEKLKPYAVPLAKELQSYAQKFQKRVQEQN